jgi:hypothetical protein
MVIVVIASYALVSAARGQPASPAPPAAVSPTPRPPVNSPTPDLRLTVTPLPPPPVTPAGTALPTPDLGPSPTAQLTVTAQSVINTLPPTVTTWVQFPGKQSHVTFDYPAGWTVVENAVVAPAYSPDPQITIYVVNYDIAKAPPRGGLPPGAVKLDIISSKDTLPALGNVFAVGPLHYAGSQIQRDRGVSADIAPGLERSIAINFAAGKRNFIILGSFAEPRVVIEQNTSLFYQIVGSVRYAGN